MPLDADDEQVLITERWGTGLLIFVSVMLHAASLLNAQPLMSANDRSRWCTVYSLVERGTFQIDEIRQHAGWDSIDIIYDEGHFYSTKPPLLSVIVAGVTWSVQRVTGWSLLNDTHAVTATVLIFVNILPFAVSLVLLSRLLKRVAQCSWCRLFVLAVAAFGTLVTPFLMTLNNHTVAVAGVMVCLFALERLLSEESPRAWAFIVCGLAAGWACANELPAAAFGLATFLLAVRRSVRQTICCYAPAALIPIIAFLATNVIATGSWKPTYANYGSSKYNFVIDGVPSYWMDPDGVDRNLDSPLVYFLHCTVGHHGIVSLTPVFLLVLIGWISSGWVQHVALRTLIRLGAILTAVVLGFYMTRFDNYNYGGVSCGLRWALWLIPFWLLAIVPIVDAAARTTVARWMQLGLLGGGMLSAWLPIENPWQQPWLFRRMEAMNWIDYTRQPPELPRQLWTWFLTMPIPPAAAEDAPWLEFTSPTADGTMRRRRLTCRNRAAGGDLVELEVSEGLGSDPLQPTRTVLIDVARFHAGASTADFLKWADPAASTDLQKQADYSFVRGLPLKKPFRAGRIRYVHLPIRTDAFRCQLAAAAVTYPLDKPTHLYRCDTWLCEELPFGVAQYEIKVTDRDNGAIVHQERWTATASNPAAAPTAPVSSGKIVNTPAASVLRLTK
ncbi:MAG: hypothetical protein JSS49_19135 [Planctomycetes bacterium]|nr:hypothetical protein [Planctomycetota bacterium]